MLHDLDALFNDAAARHESLITTSIAEASTLSFDEITAALKVVHEQFGTPTAEDVADLLDEAHDIVLTRGLHKGGNGYGPNGERCTLTSITEAGEMRYSTAEYARKAVAYHLFKTDKPPMVIAWNDNAKTTIDDVLDALRGAAKGLRNGDIDLDDLNGNRKWLRDRLLNNKQENP